MYIHIHIQLAYGTPRHRSLPYRCVQQLHVSFAVSSAAVSAAVVRPSILGFTLGPLYFGTFWLSSHIEAQSVTSCI